jgi:sec-independent protein translocase protein TatA
MAGLGWQELVIVLVIIMIIFGAGKLPEIAKSLGQGVKEFREEAQAPVAPVSSQSTVPTTTATATETTLRADANGVADEAGRVAAEAEEKLDEAADRVRAEAAKAEAASRDAS